MSYNFFVPGISKIAGFINIYGNSKPGIINNPAASSGVCWF